MDLVQLFWRLFRQTKGMRTNAALAMTLILAGGAFAQSDLFEKAPPGVEDALRARVNGFYQLWAEGKFRQAEKYVAQDSQETYYEMAKRKYDGCKILRIRYEAEFTRAVVAVECKGKWNIQGQEVDTGMVISYVWRLDKDDWYWTVHHPAVAETPFGTQGATYGNLPNASALFNKSGLPTDVKAIGDGILKQVAVDKSEVRLSSFEKSSMTVTLHNGLSGPINVRADADGAPAGFEMAFSRVLIPANEDATLTFKIDPKDKAAKPATPVRVSVEQTSQVFNILVTYAVPPEIEKLIEKSRTGK
jgi:hypothetical protein